MAIRDRVDRARIGELDFDPFLVVSPETKVADVVPLMRDKNIGSALVAKTPEGGPLVGIFTERDLLRRILGPGRYDAAKAPISSWMTAPVETIGKDATVAEAIRKMNQGAYRHLPVVDDGGRPVGMLSVKNIVHWLVEHYPESVLNLPPDPSNIALEREGA